MELDLISLFLYIFLRLFSGMWRYTETHTWWLYTYVTHTWLMHICVPMEDSLTTFSPFSFPSLQSMFSRLLFPGGKQLCFWLYFFWNLPIFCHSKCLHYNHSSYIFSLFTDNYCIFYLALPAFLSQIICPLVRWLLDRNVFPITRKQM